MRRGYRNSFLKSQHDLLQQILGQAQGVSNWRPYAVGFAACLLVFSFLMPVALLVTDVPENHYCGVSYAAR